MGTPIAAETLYSPYSKTDGQYLDTPYQPHNEQDKLNKLIRPGEEAQPYIPAPIVEDAITWAAYTLLPQLLTANTEVAVNLKGAVHFFEHLRLYYPRLKAHDIRVSRGAANGKFGKVDESETLWPPELDDLRGKRLLLIEDMNDRGDTLARIKAMAQARGVEEVISLMLFDKMIDSEKTSHATIALLAVANKYLIGRGLDDGQDRFRDLLNVYILLFAT